MRNLFTCWICLLCCISAVYGQAYSDHFDNNDPAFTGGNGFTHAESNSEWTITAAMMTGPFDPFSYQPHDMGAGTQQIVDASGNNKVFIRAKASSIGTQLRLDLQDTGQNATTQASITKTLTTDFQVLEYDFSGGYIDAGFGGTGCTTGPCPVDSQMISNLLFFANPGQGFVGSIVIDFISFGAPPDTVIMSDVFQDHFDDDSAANAVTFVGPGYTVSQSGSDLVINGDGTTGLYDPLTYVFMNMANMDTFDIDITGNNKLFVKAKSTIANTALRIDVQDIDGFASTSGSITKIVDTAYSVLEYDFSGVLADLGFGGTPCTQNTAPCPVDGSRVANLLFFIEPGVGAFPGQLNIDYMSFGVSLDPPGPEGALIYEDHFNNDTLEFTGPTPGIAVAESGSELTLTGDGTAPQFAAVSYLLHEKDSGQQIFLDMTPAKNKVFIKAKVSSGTVPLRLDLVDTANYHTSQASLTKVLNDEYNIYEFDFSGQYTDGGFGGTSCSSGPCPVDPTAITQMLLFVDPAQGGFNGEVTIDFISVGQPLGEDAGPKGITDYVDEMDDNTSLFISDPGGFTSTTTNDEWTITGDGTSGAYAAVVYDTHNDLGEATLINVVGSNDKLYVRAKASVDSTILRMDIQDNMGFVSNLNAVSNMLGTDYAIYEYSYANSYQDGAYGGSPCTTQPCAVDGERVSSLQLFVNPDDGGYNGTVSIDWIASSADLVSIKEIDYLEGVKVFPNPADQQLQVAYSLNQVANIQLKVANVMGQEMIRQDLSHQSAGNQLETIQIDGLPSGMYFLQIVADGQLAQTFRFIKL